MTNSSPRIYLASLLASLSMLLMPLGAHAGGTGKDLRNAYHDLESCMERIMDQRWADRFGVKRVVNAYGMLEPTESALDASPEVVRITEMRCRFQVGLQGEDRPLAPTAETHAHADKAY